MRRFFLLSFVLFLFVFQSGCVMYSTNSTEVGVRVKKWAFLSKKGVIDRVYKPGTSYFFLPIINDWYTFDTKLQNIEMTYQLDKGDVLGRDDLLFKTIDGNDISLDVIIAYRIDPSKAPYILENVAKSDSELRKRIIRVVARSLPRDVFGELSTELFYDSANRAKKAEHSRKLLNQVLNEYGVVVEKVLTKDYRFNDAYQQAIEDKKVADQKTQQFRSATKAKKEEYIRKLEQAKGEVNKLVAVADGEFLKEKIKVDAYYDQQKMISEAILNEGKAESLGILKMNEALAGSGGSQLVKLRIAEALVGKKIFLLPSGDNGSINLKTMDINKFLNLYGTQSLAKPKK